MKLKSVTTASLYTKDHKVRLYLHKMYITPRYPGTDKGEMALYLIQAPKIRGPKDET